MPMLRQRLRDIPDNLEEYFKRMLNSVEKVYHRYMARALLLASHSDTPLPIASYWYLDADMRNPNFAIQAKHEPYTRESFDLMKRKVIACISKWCRDLLEAFGTNPLRNDVDPIFQSQVDFLHRTVRDFLVTDEMQEFLWARAGTGYKPELTLSRIFLAHAKSIPQSLCGKSGHFHYAAGNMMHYVQQHEAKYHKTCSDLIYDLDRIGNRILPSTAMTHWTDGGASPADATSRKQRSWSPIWDEIEEDVDTSSMETQVSVRLHRKRNLLAYAVEFDLQIFVNQTLGQRPSEVVKAEGAPLLYHALSPTIPSQIGLPRQGSPYSMIAILLEKHADSSEPVQSWHGETVWRKFLKSVDAAPIKGSKDLRDVDNPDDLEALPIPTAKQRRGGYYDVSSHIIDWISEKAPHCGDASIQIDDPLNTESRFLETSSVHDSDNSAHKGSFTSNSVAAEKGHAGPRHDKDNISDVGIQDNVLGKSDAVIQWHFSALNETVRMIKRGDTTSKDALLPEDVAFLELMLHHGADPREVDPRVLAALLGQCCNQCRADFADLVR